ncbi:MAG TPA: histidine kinase [Symbiobacteriaceae bacterium]|nr:histidine kinase [Symbiobacteriaceae bacterium]
MQYRAHSRYRLARGLWALAVFAFVHAAADWGHVFIPLHPGDRDLLLVEALWGLRTMLGAISFGALLHFGLCLIGPERPRWLAMLSRFLAPTLTGGWLIGFFLYPLLRKEAGLQTWYWVSEVWSRYMLGLPACLLAAYGLIEQAGELRRDHLHAQVRSLYASAAFLILYGLTAGVVVPKQPFFPASLLNAENFFRLTHLPVEIFRAAAAIGMSIFTARLLSIFNIETTRRLFQSEEERAIFRERERIARDLHDGMLQTLYGVGLGLRGLAARLPDSDRPPVMEMKHQLNGAITDLRTSITHLRDDWVHVADLVPAVQECTGQIARIAQVPVKVEVEGFEEELGSIGVPVSFREHLLALLREGLSNAVRHSGADEIAVMLALQEDTVVLRIADKGSGFDSATILKSEDKSHYGIRNMTSRVKQLGGTFRIESIPGVGTRLLFYIPVP